MVRTCEGAGAAGDWQISATSTLLDKQDYACCCTGFGVHTFKLLTKEGKETYIKWHWISKQGAQVMPPFGLALSAAAPRARPRAP